MLRRPVVILAHIWIGLESPRLIAPQRMHGASALQAYRTYELLSQAFMQGLNTEYVEILHF